MSQIHTCSFCENSFLDDGKSTLVFSENTGSMICEDCVGFMNAEICRSKGKAERKAQSKSKAKPVEFLPRDIKATLDKHVISQDEAKKAISVAVAMHYRRLENPNISGLKSNIFLIGPSGTGKTEIGRSVSQILNVPFAIVDATSLTPAGYIGSDTNSFILNLMEQANHDIKEAQKAVVLIDEIDKVVLESANQDFKRRKIQHELLKIIEGHEVEVKSGNNPPFTFDTSNILFILSGAFVGLEQIVKGGPVDRIMGINTDGDAPKFSGEWQAQIATDHLIEFGFIPEFIGRVPVISHTNELSESDLYSILTETENSIVSQYIELMAMDGVNLKLSEGYLRGVAARAHTSRIGARGLKRELEKVLQGLYFSVHEYRNGSVTIGENGEVAFKGPKLKATARSNE